ncbi:MAG TPA: L,D-transpeptidase [Hyphomicrobiaceae bacterium]|nr:L,D-transpeptidase [Hyphomicrobiaceae bacterium]
MSIAGICSPAVVGLPQPAQAQFLPFFESRPLPRVYHRPQSRSARLSRNEAAPEATADLKKHKPTSALIAVVSLADQRIWVYGGGGLLATAPVSTGMAGYRTPTGVFSVLQKKRWHRSNIYSNAPMPYMQRLTWSGIALHAGVLPGYPASHGCIRLPPGFAQQLWGMTRLGARVVVAPHRTTVVEIAHPNLPVPTMTPAEPAATTDEVAELGTMGSEPADGDPPSRLVALKTSTDSAPPLTASAKLLNPHEMAQIVREKTRKAAADTAKAAKAAAQYAAQAGVEARESAQSLRKAQAALAAAESRVAALVRRKEGTTSVEASEKLTLELSAAELRVAEARLEVSEAQSREQAKREAAAAASAAAEAAAEASKRAASAAEAAYQALEPVSVFISRKKARLYVRQRWAPLLEVPVTIEDHELPIGTHLFVAVEPVQEGGPLRWMAVTVPETSGGSQSKQNPGRGGPEGEPPRTVGETAANALSRVLMPAEALQFISDRTWIGASLIISDHAMSNETGAYTDFIVSTR